MWSQRVHHHGVESSVTDGTRVILAGDYLTTVAVSADGVEWTRTSDLEQPMWVRSISDVGIFADFELEGAYAYGDVGGDDRGMAIVKLAP